MLIVLKHFIIIFWSQIVYLKSINHRINLKISTTQISFSIALCFPILFLDAAFENMVMPFVVILSSILNKYLTKNKYSVSVFVTTTSFGICLALHSISMLIYSFIFTFIENEDYNQFLAPLISFMAIALIVNRIFKIERLKKGFPFLHNAKLVSIGAVISSIVIICYIVGMGYIHNNEVLSKPMLILFAFIIICFVLIIAWWRKGITKTYKERLRMDEIKRLKATIEEIDQDNRVLAKIIHKDNKVFGAMELAVQAIIEATAGVHVDLSKKAARLLEQLQEEIGDRKGIATVYQKYIKTLPETGVNSIDTMLNYMLQRANEVNADLDVIVTKSLKHLTESIIGKDDLRTLIADLLENAIIATKTQEHKKVMFTIGIEADADGNAYYVLRFQDSGAYFDSEVLRNLGKKQITTHAGDGGSGIGMIQTFDILNEIKASFLLEEYPQKKFSFTKVITVRFDGKNEVKINALAAV